MKKIIQEPMNQEKATVILDKGKNLFLDEKYLDWKVITYIRNYVEFLEMDYEGLKREAHDFHQKNLIGSDYLQRYLSELDSAYNQAKLYLEIE